jgi:hypothetical protein
MLLKIIVAQTIKQARFKWHMSQLLRSATAVTHSKMATS